MSAIPFPVDREREAVINRGRDATTFLTMPFWKEIQEFLQARIVARLKALEDAVHADAVTTKVLADKWRIEKAVIQDVLNYPHAAIEAARDAQAGGSYGG